MKNIVFVSPNFPENYRLFCRSLKEITLPDSVTSIGEYAFDSCVSLTCFTIPDGVKTIQGHTFSYCEDLESVAIPDSVQRIGKSALFPTASKVLEAMRLTIVCRYGVLPFRTV